MACRSRPCLSRLPRAFPVALGWPIAVNRGKHPVLVGKPCQPLPSRLRPRGSTSAGGMCAPARKQAERAPAPDGGGCHRSAPMPGNRWGACAASPLLATTCFGALVLQPPAVAAGIAGAWFWPAGSRGAAAKVELEAMTPGALQLTAPWSEVKSPLPGVWRHGDQPRTRNCPPLALVPATCALSLVLSRQCLDAGREAGPAGARPLRHSLAFAS